MRFQCVSPLLCTVGTVTAIRNTLRPTLGSVSSVLASSTSACDAFEVSISGASAVTVIDLLDGADFERDVERDELLRADADAAPLEGLEPLHRGLDGVGRRIERRERILARLVRDRVARDAVGFVDQRDRDAGNDALRVLDRAAHAALERLRRGQPGRNPEHTDTDDGSCEKLPRRSAYRPS